VPVQHGVGMRDAAGVAAQLGLAELHDQGR